MPSFLQHLSNGKNVAANFIGLKDVQEFARAGADQQRVGLRRHQIERRFHQGNWIATGVGDATGQDG